MSSKYYKEHGYGHDLDSLVNLLFNRIAQLCQQSKFQHLFSLQSGPLFTST